MAYTDTCINIKDTSVKVWLNPNIKLTGPISGAYKADPPPDLNALAVNVHLLDNCELEDPSDPVRVEVWVSPVNAAPPTVAQYTRIATGAISGQALDDLLANGSEERAFNWLVNLGDPNQQPGHHCLRARAFPSSNTPPTQFDMNDQHEGQHNICIVPCASPCGQEVFVWTAQEEELEIMTLQTMVDLEPSGVLIESLWPLLEKIPGFQGFLFDRPPRFEIVPGEELEVVDIRDNNEPSSDGTYGGHRFPNFEVDLALEPGRRGSVQFLTDLEGVEPGFAFMYHLTHLGRDRQVQGGLTAITVRQIEGKG